MYHQDKLFLYKMRNKLNAKGLSSGDPIKGSIIVCVNARDFEKLIKMAGR